MPAIALHKSAFTADFQIVALVWSATPNNTDLKTNASHACILLTICLRFSAISVH
jgi:hypothetical protein